jgi:tetratricopeptide (TPR) repeat protein
VRTHSFTSRERLWGGLALGIALLAPSPARAIDGVRWPTAALTDRGDPLSPVRWPQGGWSFTLSGDLTSAARAAQVALAVFDRRIAENPRDARSLAGRAVILRLLGRSDESRRALDRALALDGTLIEDADVALTRAMLSALAGQYAAAVRDGRVALARLGGSLIDRVEVSVELARWSLLRGPEGLPEALAVLREAATTSVRDSHQRASLAAVLLLLGREVEAREVARSGDLPDVRFSLNRPARGTLFPVVMNGVAALAASLTDRAPAAVTLLRETARAPELSSFQGAVSRALTRASSVRSPASRPAADLVNPLFVQDDDE